MDASASASPDLDSVARRRSGRVVCAPAKFAPEANASKRKRGDPDDEDGETDDVLSDEELSNETEEGSDAEHPAPRSRSRKPPPAARSRKPSNKKPRINGSQPAAPGHVTRIPSRPKKTVRIVAGDEGTGLFADIFNSGDSPDAVAHKWLERYREDDAAALCDVVNCILQAAGCDLQVTVDDIRDPENIPIRLVELQSIYQEVCALILPLLSSSYLIPSLSSCAADTVQQHITDYPLVSKAKSMRSFREILVNFYHALIGLLHETDLLYKDPDLLDNIHAWLASMSSSSLRPFRHTATTIALAVQSGLVEVAGVLDRRIANIEHQAQATKKGKNKSKAAEIERSLDEANDYRKACNEFIQSFFDTVFVHRYRDVDPKIRTECVEALGSWIWHLPTVFMEPGYLRYLGWMLSDTHGPTRQEVLKQLSRVFKRDAQQLGHFIDRFRPRLIEMATLDADMSVRVAAISAIDTLRAAALLELSEIDAIGKLVFDTEPKIRKTVVNFFVACIDDVRQSKIEDIGGTNVLDELDVADEDDFESPRQEWINIKCLAETLAIYDAQIEETQQNRGLAVDIDFAADFVELSAPETRISLAAQVLYDKIPEVKMWELLAGYLLFDHTISTKSKSLSARNSTETAIFMKAVAPTGEEESILLDVLSSAIKSCLAPVGEHDRTKRRGHRVEAAEAQEETALELTTVIPKLLNKFGAVPETAAIVLRLEHSLKLSMFQQLRQDTSKYDKILDEISIQFNRHDDKRVLSEATSALLHARQHEELEELTDSKLSVLWENVINALRNFDTTCELSVRGNLAAAPLRELSTALMKISKLASISDCVDALEAIPGSGESRAPAIEMLSDVVHRGKYDPQEDDDEMDELEDEVVSFAIKACQFYFMWKTRALSQLLAASTSISDAEIDRFSLVRQRYRRHLIETFSSRVAIDELRLFATGSLCDLHLIFVTLRRLIKELGSQTGRASKLRALVQEIEPGLVPELLSIFDGAEKKYAKKAKKDKMLNEPAEDEDPMADDDEELDDDDNDMSKEQRYAAEFRAEKALCELTAKYVLVLSARIIDDRGAHARKLHRRMLRNKTKLGNNFKEVVAYLDEEVRPAARQAAKKAAGGPGSSNSQHANAGGLKTADARSQAAKVAANDDNGDDVENDGVEDVAADDEDLLFDDVPPEEGSREDLRRRELLDEENPVEDSSDETPKQMDTDLDDTVLGD